MAVKTRPPKQTYNCLKYLPSRIMCELFDPNFLCPKFLDQNILYTKFLEPSFFNKHSFVPNLKYNNKNNTTRLISIVPKPIKGGSHN